MKTLQVEQARVLELAKQKPETEDGLRVLFPEAFKDEPVSLRKSQKSSSDSILRTGVDGIPCFLSKLKGSSKNNAIKAAIGYRFELREQHGGQYVQIFRK